MDGKERFGCKNRESTNDDRGVALSGHRGLKVWKIPDPLLFSALQISLRGAWMLEPRRRELPQCHRYEVLMPTRTSAFRSRSFLRVLLRERLSPVQLLVFGKCVDCRFLRDSAIVTPRGCLRACRSRWREQGSKCATDSFALCPRRRRCGLRGDKVLHFSIIQEC